MSEEQDIHCEDMTIEGCEACYFKDRRRKVIVRLQDTADTWLPDTDDERTWEDYEDIASGEGDYKDAQVFAAFVVVQTIALEELHEESHTAGDCTCWEVKKNEHKRD
tara:strand:+ start:361 stop:681 length:321 start_codon:yes stop_codon:yes gene_type:complete